MHTTRGRNHPAGWLILVAAACFVLVSALAQWQEDEHRRQIDHAVEVFGGG